MQAFECHGLWMLPESDGRPAAGTLRVSPGGDLRLSLIGSLGPREGVNQNKQHAVILGSVDGPFGNKVTLADCYVTRSSFGSHADMREEYRAHRGYFGAHLRGPGFSFRRMQLQVGGLRAWAHSLSGFRQGGLGGKQADEEAALLYYSMSSPVGGSIAGGEISLGFGLTSSGTLEGYSFAEKPGVALTFDTPVSEADINKRFVYPLQNLMTLVCDRAQEIESVSLWQEDILAAMEENPEIRLIGARILPDAENEKTRAIHPHELLFALSDIEDSFAPFVERWFRLTTTFADACDVFFGLEYGPPAYLDVTFLGLIQSLSLYYTRRVDGVKHRNQEDQRLTEVLEKLSEIDADWVRNHIGVRPFPPVEHIVAKLLNEHAEVMNPLLRREQQGFINEVMSTLHYALRRDPEAALAAIHGVELYWMTAKLRILLKLCLLRELGFNAEKSRSFFEKNGVYQHLCKIARTESNR